MAEVLSDSEIQKLIGTVIVNGDPGSVRPNAYVLRLGGEGEFINTGKEFRLGQNEKKKGVKIAPGHAVGMTALETIDFRRETVEKTYPGCDLHGILSPTTDLAREGIVAPATQIDAGYCGTLNWTLTNTSAAERRFTFGERIYRLMILKLKEGERPAEPYKGYYQEKTGYVRSQRTGAPVGMKEAEWEDGFEREGPEMILETLIKSGYPWNMLGQQFKTIDQQFKTVTSEYAEIHDSISQLTTQIASIKEKQGGVADVVRSVLKDESKALRNDTLVTVSTLLAGFSGAAMTFYSSDRAVEIVKANGIYIGLAVLVCAITAFMYVNKRR